MGLQQQLQQVPQNNKCGDQKKFHMHKIKKKHLIGKKDLIINYYTFSMTFLKTLEISLKKIISLTSLNIIIYIFCIQEQPVGFQLAISFIPKFAII